ncbi:MAG: AhpC/TSA family protein [Gemmataceae bacterium]
MAHLGQVQTRHADFTAAGTTILVIVQAPAKHLAPYLERHPLPFPVYSDPERQLYRHVGLGRVGWLHFFQPKVFGNFLRLFISGGRIRKPVSGEDVLQEGGDFVVDATGKILHAFPSSDATDRPSLDTLLSAVGARPTSG